MRKVKQLFVFIDIFNLVVYCGICIVISLGYDHVETGQDFYFSLRIFQIYLVVLLFFGLYYVGIQLLRQIRKYAYDTPHILVVSLYFSLCGFAAGMMGLGMIVTLPSEYRQTAR